MCRFLSENVGQDGKFVDLNFATYIAFSMPIAIINLFLVWIILSVIFLGRPKRNASKSNDIALSEVVDLHVIQENSSNQNVAALLRRKLDELGTMSFHEKAVSVLIMIAVLLWLFRDPRVVPGWISMFPESYPRIGDSSVAIAILLLMFIIPKDLKYFRGGIDKFISM